MPKGYPTRKQTDHFNIDVELGRFMDNKGNLIDDFGFIGRFGISERMLYIPPKDEAGETHRLDKAKGTKF